VITCTPAAIRRPGEQRSSPGRTSRSMPRAGCRSADGSPISAYRQQRAGPGGAAPRGAGLQLSWQPGYFTDTPSWARAFRRIEGSDEHGDPAGCPRRRELSRPLSADTPPRTLHRLPSPRNADELVQLLHQSLGLAMARVQHILTTWTGGGPPRFPLTSRWTALGCSRLWKDRPVGGWVRR